MAIPTPPVPPSVPLPLWAYNSGSSERRDPGNAKRLQGWGYYDQSSTKLGESPSYQNDNFNRNLCGAWYDYFNRIIDYVTQFFGNATASDSNYSNFITLSQSQRIEVSPINNPSLIQMDVTKASRYPTNLSSSPWDGIKFTCPVVDYYDVSFQCSLGATIGLPNSDLPLADFTSAIYNSIDVSIYKNNTPFVTNKLGGFMERVGYTLMRIIPLFITQTIYCQKGDIIQFYINNSTLNNPTRNFCPLVYGSYSTLVPLAGSSTNTILINNISMEANISWNFSS
jgi:hypothetical protein